MMLHCMPAAVASLAATQPGRTVEIRGIAGRDGTRLPLPPGAIVQVLGRTGNAVRVRKADGHVLLIDLRLATLVRVEAIG